MLIAVRAEVEDVETWRQGFKTHGDLFKSQGVSVAYMGATDEKSVIGVFDTNDVDAFMRIFNDPATAEAMANDKITGGVELFVLGKELVVNEIAPRVHNSGHWTQDGCAIDQFEQHIRAICGWPLGDGSRHMNVSMRNLLGDDILELSNIAHETKAAIHLYGKEEIRPNRKMGHVNYLTQKS